MEGWLINLYGPMLADGSMAENIDKLARTPLSKILILSAVLTVLRIALYPVIKKTPAHLKYGNYKVAKLVDSFCDAVVYAAVVVFMLVRPFVLQTFNIPTGSMIDTLRVGDFIVANKNIYRHSDPALDDVVVFKPPQTALFANQDPETDFIKRCIGIPGVIVEWKGKKLYRDGKVIDEPKADYTVPGQENSTVAPRDTWDQIPQPDFKVVQDGDRYISVQYTDSAVNGFPIDASGQDIGLTRNQGTVVPASLEEAMRWKAAPPAKIPDGFYLFMGDNRNGSLDGRFWGLVPRESIIGKAEIIWLPVARWRRIG